MAYIFQIWSALAGYEENFSYGIKPHRKSKNILNNNFVIGHDIV